MQFNAKIDYQKLSMAFSKIPLIAAKELRLELNKSLKAVQINARMRHRFKRDTGQLEKSIQEDVEPSGLSGKVWLEESVASYGKFVHDGTKEHFISPKSKKALYFVSGGQKRFSKGHNVPGIKKDQFLFEAMEKQEPDIVARITVAVKRIFDAAGLK